MRVTAREGALCPTASSSQVDAVGMEARLAGSPVGLAESTDRPACDGDGQQLFRQ